MLRQIALLVPFVLTLTSGLAPAPALAFDGRSAPARGLEGGLDGRATAQSPGRRGPSPRIAQEGGNYGDIMDDVDAVIDAMDDAIERGPTPPGDLPATEFSGAASGARNAQPRIAQGPRTPSPIVIELFTAQGCDACPPAEEMLASMTGRPDVLVLSWHVDYWDYLGWADSFARPEFSARQKGYNLSRGARMLFTPQMIIAGETAIDDPNPAELMAAIKHERAEGDHVAISRRGDGARSEIELSPLRALPEEIAIQLIRYLPDRKVEVSAGENAGKHLAMNNIVVGSEVLARWNGKAPLRMTVTLGAGPAGNLPADTRHALIVQHMRAGRPGEIFATILLD